MLNRINNKFHSSNPYAHTCYAKEMKCIVNDCYYCVISKYSNHIPQLCNVCSETYVNGMQRNKTICAKFLHSGNVCETQFCNCLPHTMYKHCVGCTKITNRIMQIDKIQSEHSSKYTMEQHMEMDAELTQLRAALHTYRPKKYITLYGIRPGITVDDEKLNAYNGPFTFEGCSHKSIIGSLLIEVDIDYNPANLAELCKTNETARNYYNYISAVTKPL